MTYAGTTIFTFADIVLILALVLIPLSAMAPTTSVVKELFRAINLIGSVYLASTLHTILAKYVYNNLTQNISIGFLNTMFIFIIFFAAYFFGRMVINYLGDCSPGALKYDTAIKIILRFITTYVLLSIAVYFFHAKLKIFKEAKARYSHGIVYRNLYFTGRNLLNITAVQGSRYYY